jgi:hypothetical protein
VVSDEEKFSKRCEATIMLGLDEELSVDGKVADGVEI